MLGEMRTTIEAENLLASGVIAVGTGIVIGNASGNSLTYP
jgi:hypothetical protein